MNFLMFFSVFCLVLGLLLLIIRGRFFPELRKETFFSGLLIVFGFVFVLLSLFGVMAGFAEKLSGNVDTCEWVINQTDGPHNGTLTHYYYINTCDFQENLLATEIIYSVYLWVLFFIGLLTIGGFAYLIISKINKY